MQAYIIKGFIQYMQAYIILSYMHGLMIYKITEDAPDAKKDSFYDLLKGAVRNVAPHDQLVVAGDLNAVTATERSGFEQAIGYFGSRTSSDNYTWLLHCAHFLSLGGRFVVSPHGRPTLDLGFQLQQDHLPSGA